MTKRFIAALFLTVLLASIAFAAESDWERRLPGPGGGVLTVTGVEKRQDKLVVSFIAKPREDMQIAIEGRLSDYTAVAVYDSNGNRFGFYKPTISIGDKQTSERIIIGGISTKISAVARHKTIHYRPAAIFPRVEIYINGEMIVFRNVPLR